MACCRCKIGICVDCRCRSKSRPCTNCESSQCTNVYQSQPQKAVLLPLLQLPSTESVSADSDASDKNASAEQGATSAETKKSTAVQSAPDLEAFPPPNWEYYRGSLESCIVRMYRSPLPHVAPSSNHRALMLVRSFMFRTWHMTRGKADVISVRQVENPLLYRRYVARRREIALAAQGSKLPIVELANMPNERDVDTNTYGLNLLDKTLRKELNEVYLLHGTASTSVDAIARLGLDIRLSRDTALYGRGIYLAESLDKAFMYTDFVQRKSLLGKQCVVIVRATLGRIYLNKKMKQFCRPPCTVLGCRELDHCTRHGDLHDSIVYSDSRSSLPREFIVFDGSQCYPELVVTFQVLPNSISS